MKALVACFSAQGTTAALAKALAEKTGADLFEIRPEVPYTAADIRWTNPLARCNREKIGKKDVPVAGTVADWESYDLVYLGFPIWYYGAPNVVNTFCKGYNWEGKQAVLFATSGGSDLGTEASQRAAAITGAEVLPGRRFPADAAADALKAWAEQF